MRRSGLIRPFETPVAAARALLGLQAQVLHSAGLSLSCRLPGPFTHTDLATALYDERSIVKLWGHRRTLHLYAPEDWPTLNTLFSGRETWAKRATKRVGGDVEALEAGIADIAVRLKSVDTLSKRTVLDQRPDLATFLNLGIGLFMDVVQMGVGCHARPVGSESHFAHRENWLPALDWDPPSRHDAGLDAARRYLGSYGPATVQDLAFWLGEKVTVARQWLGALRDETVTVETTSGPQLLLGDDLDTLCGSPPSRSKWPVRLLHRYDVLVLAHKDKSWLIDRGDYKKVWKAGGVVEPVVLVGGRIVGVWKYERRTKSIRVSVAQFGKLAAHTKKKLAAQAERVASYLELELASLEFV